jgi:hypothetical protein
MFKSSVEPSDYTPEVGRHIRHWSPGSLQGNYYHDDPDGKRFVSKVYRLSNKILSNRMRGVDLLTGETVTVVEHGLYWWGPDAARRCREEKDLYLVLQLDFKNDKVRGYLPAD